MFGYELSFNPTRMAVCSAKLTLSVGFPTLVRKLFFEKSRHTIVISTEWFEIADNRRDLAHQLRQCGSHVRVDQLM